MIKLCVIESLQISMIQFCKKKNEEEEINLSQIPNAVQYILSNQTFYKLVYGMHLVGVIT